MSKIYGSIIGFQENYQNDFQEWNSEYPNGREIDFLNYIKSVYEPFSKNTFKVYTQKKEYDTTLFGLTEILEKELKDKCKGQDKIPLKEAFEMLIDLINDNSPFIDFDDGMSYLLNFITPVEFFEKSIFGMFLLNDNQYKDFQYAITSILEVIEKRIEFLSKQNNETVNTTSEEEPLNAKLKNVEEYNREIFKNKYSSDLFSYLIEYYYNQKKDKFIQIFRFMVGKFIICSQSKFIEFIKEKGISISKITASKHNEQITIGERKKEFDSQYTINNPD